MAHTLPAVRTPGSEPAPPKREPETMTISPVHPMAVVEPSALPAELDRGLMVKPWERMVRETDAMWTLFLAFRDMAYPDGPLGRYVPRNATALAQAVGMNPRTVQAFAQSFQWFARAGAFDRALDAAKTEADISEVRRARLRHTRLAAKARLALEGEMDKWLARSQDPEISSMSPKEVLQGLELIVKMERLLVGEATDHIKVDSAGEWDLESLELTDLEALDRVRRKAKGRG